MEPKLLKHIIGKFKTLKMNLIFYEKLLKKIDMYFGNWLRRNCSP